MERKINEYTIVRPLGNGGFGTVHLVRSSRNELFAAKVIPISTQLSKEDLQKQPLLLARLNHKNILSLREFFFWNDEKSLVIITPYCNQGTLDDIIGRATVDINRLMLDMAEAIQYLHLQHKLVHLDIKPLNIFIKENRAIVGDMGISKIMRTTNVTSNNDRRGTPFYMAPERLTSNRTDFPSDIWSLGLVYLELNIGRSLQGSNPPSMSPDFPTQELLNKVMDPRMRGIIASMLKRNPSERASIRDVVKALGGQSQTSSRAVERVERVERGETVDRFEVARRVSEVGRGERIGASRRVNSSQQENQVVLKLYKKTEDLWMMRYPQIQLKKDYIEHFSTVETEAERNNVKAMFLLGRMYTTGHGPSLNPSQAKQWLMKCAELNEPFCFASLFNLETDIIRKRQYLQRGAALEDARSCQTLGRSLFYGINDCQINKERGTRLLKISADKGFPKAWYWLGRLHSKSTFTDFKITDAGLQYYLRAAELGHKKSMQAIGKFEDQQRNYQGALEWYLKAHDVPGKQISKEEGTLAYNIAMCYQDLGNKAKSKQWLLKAAEVGNTSAVGKMCVLGYI